MKTLKVKTTVELPLDRIADFVCTAMEGGIGYWSQIQDTTCGPDASDDTLYDSKQWPKATTPEYVTFAISPHTNVVLGVLNDDESDFDGKRVNLNLNAIKRGLEIMAEKYPLSFAALVSGNEDQPDCDILIQCAVLGDAIYG